MTFLSEIDFSDRDVNKYVLYNPIQCMKPVLIDYDVEELCLQLKISKDAFLSLQQNERRSYIYSFISENIKSDICKNIDIPNVRTENINLKICTYYEKCKNCSRGNCFSMPLNFKDKTTKTFKFCYHNTVDSVNVSFCSIDGEVKNLPSKNGNQLILKSFYPVKINENKNSLASSFPKEMIDEKNNYVLRYIPDDSKILKKKLDFEHNQEDFPVTMSNSELKNSELKNSPNTWKPSGIIKPRSITPIIIRSESSVSNCSQQSIVERRIPSSMSSPRLDEIEKKIKEEFPFLELEKSINPSFKTAMEYIFCGFKKLEGDYQNLRDEVQVLKIQQGISTNERDTIIQQNDELKRTILELRRDNPYFDSNHREYEDQDEDYEFEENSIEVYSDDDNNSFDY